ncbi:unnamed protein product [Didymodactylos carnosus]|uniref:Sacsin/Nov domain-containing protein n=1 Tax=Didymodactylos carnosus TaxID=1234261 RepID=A0A814YTN8_9BILA|nr:unnamed protein product [Didymodactylos carnosus]CAF1233164.1 unnamed protein product [Didymodactylos carnosus]CAF3818357.1 unnamed protein product [Didymodactylos carnosus]CAF3995682.1 unnamed protein product [Didymodactylos carnosus]
MLLFGSSLGITSLGEGSKNSNTSKIGRYGVGFNTVYRLTDVPTFISSDKFVIFDPLLKHMPSVTKRNPGRQCKVKLLEKFLDVLHTFLPSSFDLRNGTIFRIPLRVSQSEISDKVYRRSRMIKLLYCLVDELPTYCVDISSTRSGTKSYLIADGVGFTSMHVHGYFYLSNESRYNLWKTDNVNDVRRLWNEALAEHLLSQGYVQIVCRAAEQVQKHSLSIERYLTLFVDGTNKENLIQLLIKNAYETFFNQDLFIIPTLSLHVFPRIESTRIFVWTYASDSKLRFIRKFNLFVSKSKECRDECITECLNSLLLIGLKICDRPKLLDLLKNDKNIMYDLNAVKLCDELRAYRSLHQKEILPIERTAVLMKKNVYTACIM